MSKVENADDYMLKGNIVLCRLVVCHYTIAVIRLKQSLPIELRLIVLTRRTAFLTYLML